MHSTRQTQSVSVKEKKLSNIRKSEKIDLDKKEASRKHDKNCDSVPLNHSQWRNLVFIQTRAQPLQTLSSNNNNNTHKRSFNKVQWYIHNFQFRLSFFFLRLSPSFMYDFEKYLSSQSLSLSLSLPRERSFHVCIVYMYCSSRIWSQNTKAETKKEE